MEVATPKRVTIRSAYRPPRRCGTPACRLDEVTVSQRAKQVFYFTGAEVGIQ